MRYVRLGKLSSIILAVLLAVLMLAAVSCTDGQNGDQTNETESVSTPSEGNGPDDPIDTDDGGSDIKEDDTLYTITFMNGEEIISSVTGKRGEFVDIPTDIVSDDPRLTFAGWDGLEDYEIVDGKIEIYGRRTYSAVWKEAFGTENVFNATKVAVTDHISVDGTLDAAYGDTQSVDISTVVSGETDVTAKAYFMWDDEFVYVFVDVTDPSVHGWDNGYAGSQAIQHYDTMEMRIDLLHSDRLAKDGYTTGWGQPYRGEPGPMCEAYFKISAGFTPSEGKRFAQSDLGSIGDIDGWWSFSCNDDPGLIKDGGKSLAVSKITETGYTIEYRIYTQIGDIPAEMRPHVGQEIGVGIKLFDKTEADLADTDRTEYAANVVAMEEINSDMSSPMRLSNVKLSANPNDADKTVTDVKGVRGGYTVTVDGKKDPAYADSKDVSFGRTKASMLWDTKGLYVYMALGSNTEYLKISGDGLDGEIDITADNNEILIANKDLEIGSVVTLKVTYKEADADPVETECYFKMKAGEAVASYNGVDRHVFTAEKLDEGAVINSGDGIRDEAYGEQIAVIETQALKNNDNLKAKGKAWARWDDKYLYVFIEVTDSDVSKTQKGNYYDNDSVEIWLDTFTDQGQAGAGFGVADVNNVRGYYSSGEQKLVEHSVTRTENGYNAELKMSWVSSFASKDKVGEMIGFMLNINDDNGNDGNREGIVSTNTGGQDAWTNSSTFDRLVLVNSSED